MHGLVGCGRTGWNGTPTVYAAHELMDLPSPVFLMQQMCIFYITNVKFHILLFWPRNAENEHPDTELVLYNIPAIDSNQETKWKNNANFITIMVFWLMVWFVLHLFWLDWIRFDIPVDDGSLDDPAIPALIRQARVRIIGFQLWGPKFKILHIWIFYSIVFFEKSCKN